MKLARSLLGLALGRRTAHLDGTLSARALHDRVTLRRDRHGIVYIDARNDDDAWFGLGFAQGQDRAFQLDTLVRAARGTLCEATGAEMLPIDRLSRRIGFGHVAKLHLAVMDGDLQRQLHAFAAGVTEGLQRGGPRVAHEFALLGLQPRVFTAEDVLAVLAFLAFALAANWDVELARWKILRADGEGAVRDLDPGYPAHLPVVCDPDGSAGPALERLAGDLAHLRDLVGGPAGSNAWAVSAARTRTGRPLVSSDPHLQPVLPVHWYLAQVRTPEWSIAGACFVSQPGFSAGHNGRAAWGVTAGHADTTDLFLEELDAEGTHVRDGDRWVRCEVREERIRVRGGRDVTERVLVTPRGPLVSPAFEEHSHALSMRATWMAARPIRGLFGFHRVRDFEEFRATNRTSPAASIVYVYADTGGTIGANVAGDVPQRRASSGQLPTPGWKPECQWHDEPVPFEKMPFVRDPSAGFVVAANNAPVPHEDAPFLGTDWLDGYRAARLTEALGARADWDPAATVELWRDTRSMAWREAREALLSVRPRSTLSSRALGVLARWDGDLRADSAGAAVFEFWLGELHDRVVHARAPRGGRWALGQGYNDVFPHNLFTVRRLSHLVNLLREQPADWFPRGWPEELTDALEAAASRVARFAGPDPERWAWGHLRPVTMVHLAGTKKPLDRFFNLGPVPCGGDSSTVSQAATDLHEPTANPMGVATMRIVVDVGAWDETRVMLRGGQSGNPLSSHYDDLFEAWQRHEAVPLWWSPARILEHTAHTLELVPG